MQCDNCPLKNSSIPCMYDELGHRFICNKVDPNSPEYDPKVPPAVINNSTDYYNKLNNPELVPEPSLINKVINLGGAVKRIVTNGFGLIASRTYQARLNNCQDCHFRKEDWTCSHPDCGCFLREKARLATETCPIGQWDEEMLIYTEDATHPDPVIDAIVADYGANSDCGCSQNS